MIENVKIENDIPLPEPVEGFTAIVSKMEVGQSFVLPLRKRNGIRSYFALRGWGCVTKKISDTEARVWRVK